MSSTPAFTITPRVGRAVVSAATTDRTGATTTNIVDILTGAATGTQINEIVAMASGDLADSCILLFVHNGTDYRLIDDWDVGDPAAASNTVSGYRQSQSYSNLWLPSASFKLAAAITVAPASGNLVVWGLGADL